MNNDTSSSTNSQLCSREPSESHVSDWKHPPCFTQFLLLLNSIEKTVSSLVSVWGRAPKKARLVSVNLETDVKVSASGVSLSKKGLSAHSLLPQLPLNPITPFCPQKLRKKSSSAALKCAVVYCFHIKPWMDGLTRHSAMSGRASVSVLAVLSARQRLKINIGKYRRFFLGNFLWHSCETFSEIHRQHTSLQ